MRRSDRLRLRTMDLSPGMQVSSVRYQCNGIPVDKFMNGQVISVGPRMGRVWVGVGLGGLGLVGLAIWLDQGFPRNQRDFVLPSFGLVLLTLIAIRYVWICMSWRTVVDTGDGMIVADRSGTNEYSDEQVVR